MSTAISHIINIYFVIGRPVASRNFADTTDDENTIPVKNVSRNEAGESFQLDNFQGSGLYNDFSFSYCINF